MCDSSNAKLTELTVGYSHSNVGSILTRFSPGAQPHLLSETENPYRPLNLNFTHTPVGINTGLLVA